MNFYQLSQEWSGKLPGTFSRIFISFRQSMMGLFFLAVVSPAKIRLFIAEDTFRNISTVLAIFPDLS